MAINTVITDNRTARDYAAIELRNPLPFGQNFRSRYRPIATRATVTGGAQTFITKILGQTIVWGESPAVVVPVGITRAIPVTLGYNPIPVGTTVYDAVGCTAAVDTTNVFAPYAVVSAITGDAWVNVITSESLPVDSAAYKLALGAGPWVTQGLTGLSINSTGTLLPGIDNALGVAVNNPTMPDVLLRLWVQLSGGTDGLDLVQLQAMATRNRALGLFYNGDVYPDRFEAWVHQAAYSHGLRAGDSSYGVTLSPMGTPTQDTRTYLLSNTNSRDLVRRWETPVDNRVRYGIGYQHEYKAVSASIEFPSHVEELLGVRPSDDLHVAKVTALWAEERALVTRYKLQIPSPPQASGRLRVNGTIALVDSTVNESWAGYVTEKAATGIRVSWSSVLAKGFTESAANSQAATLTLTTLTDYTKTFALAAFGDVLELSIAGQITIAYITAVQTNVLTFAPALPSIPVASTFRLLHKPVSVPVHWQLPGHAITSATSTPVYDGKLQEIVYPVPTTLPTGTPIVTGTLTIARIHAIDGTNFTCYS